MRLIDADALIEAIRHDVDQTPNSDWGFGLNHAIPIVRSQPTVDALELLKEQRPKTGHWIVVEGKKGKVFDTRVIRCDVCWNFLKMSCVNAGVGDANYCPNCGAKMVE